MGFTYENQGSYTYLVYALDKEERIDSMSLGMLTNNTIQGMAQTFYTQMNEDRFIKYNVSAKVTLKQFFTGPVNRHRLLSVFYGISSAVLDADDYMIDSRNLLLNPDYIFVDVTTCQTALVCLPVVSDTLKETDMLSFFRNIIFTTQSDPTENCDHVAKIINYLNSSPVFSLLNFKDLIGELMNGVSQAMPAQNMQPYADSHPTPATGMTGMWQPPQSEKVRSTESHPMPQHIPRPTDQQMRPAVAVAPEQSAVAPEQSTVVPAHKASSQPAKAEPMPTAEKSEQPAPDEGKTGMTAWYLLRHYTKENAELYKAQKNAKPVKSKSESKKKAASGGQMPSFAIPGQEAPVSSSISTPTPQPVATKTAPQPVAPKTTSQSQVSQNPTPQPTPQHPSRQVQVAPQPPVPPPQPYSGVPQVGQQPIQTYVREEVTYAPSGNFGETTMLTARNAGETTMLVHNPAQRAEPYLLRLRTKERIALTKELFRIGKEPSYADYVVSDNPAVSRSHAYIILRDGGHYIVDTNSKNHTYLNGMMLRSNTEMLLSDNDRLRLADEEFEFHTR